MNGFLNLNYTPLPSVSNENDLCEIANLFIEIDKIKIDEEKLDYEFNVEANLKIEKLNELIKINNLGRSDREYTEIMLAVNTGNSAVTSWNDNKPFNNVSDLREISKNYNKLDFYYKKYIVYGGNNDEV